MPGPRPSGRPCRHATEAAPVCPACVVNRARVKAWADAHPGHVSARAVAWGKAKRTARRRIWTAYRLRHPFKVSAYARARSACERGAVHVERVCILELYARDRGTCWLCGEPVPAPGSDCEPAASATIDHVIPASLGGAHAYGNARLAHLGCNARRGAPDVDTVPF